MTERPTKPGMSFRAKAVLWTVLSLVLGGIGGGVSVYLGAPFYFGFFFALVLTGLSGLFALAAHVGNTMK
jgi:asparagine N-glycosylation enzyme membrane subunit Stt3